MTRRAQTIIAPLSLALRELSGPRRPSCVPRELPLVGASSGPAPAEHPLDKVRRLIETAILRAQEVQR